MKVEAKDNEKSKERYIRWQDYRIQQLGYVNYIILILCSGLLVFLIKFNITNYYIHNQNQLIHSIIFISISLIVGVLLAFNRLLSFKWTAKKIYKIWKNKMDFIELYEFGILMVDRITWILISLQLIFFSIGIWLLLLFGISN